MRSLKFMLSAISVGGVLSIWSGGASAQFGPLPGAGLTVSDLVIDGGAPSKARGAPLAVPNAAKTVVGPVFGTGDGRFVPAVPLPPIFGARDGGAPKGIKPLDHDIFSTTDFYADRNLWLDQRYYRCAAPQMLELFWQDQFQVVGGKGPNPALGSNPPRTIAWGQCNVDYPRANMVSPYSYSTAREHYEALKAEAKSRGGPTIKTRADLPDWDGQYFREAFGTSGEAARELNWEHAAIQQIPTYLSLLTPEFQQRMVQQLYHDAHNHSLYPGAFCWPEGYMRKYFAPSVYMMLSPQVAQIWSWVSATLWTPAYIGREFHLDGSVPYLNADVRQYYGESVGFWDGNILVTWTSNIKGWFSHGWFETSDQLQTINIYSQINGPDGKMLGIKHEAVLYDSKAFVQPLRMINYWARSGALNEGRVFDFRECNASYYPINGVQTGVSPGETFKYIQPDLNGRPWADIWEREFEKDMAAKPKAADVLSGF